ncbi:uncharacterized protein LOC116259919 [Nymphaea colorata]|nr:uncharacterized protein LOC116259919 [Nymphaea colorata]
MSPNVTVDGNARVHPAPERPRRTPELVSRSCDDSSLDSASWSSGASSDSSLGLGAARRGAVTPRLGCRRNQSGMKSRRVAPDGVAAAVRGSPRAKSRCGWVTANTDPLYASFHDEEWGVPVHDDKRLFELLSLSGALAELSWPTILSKRETFRDLFASFDPALVSKFSERKITSLKNSNNIMLSELKLRSIVENAKQILKVVDECGSFNNYCWGFVNHKPTINRFRYQRQVPVKSPKAEAFSKDLIRRGFRSVGPTTVYSFMQAAGLVNDHLISCYRFEECSSVTDAVDLGCYESKQKIAEKKVQDVMGLAEQMNGCMLGV